MPAPVPHEVAGCERPNLNDFVHFVHFVTGVDLVPSREKTLLDAG